MENNDRKYTIPQYGSDNNDLSVSYKSGAFDRSRAFDNSRSPYGGSIMSVNSGSTSGSNENDSMMNTESLDISAARNISWQQQFTDCSNVFKAFIGSVILGMPFAVSQAGIILAVIGIAVIGFLNDHCCTLIVKCKQEVISRIVTKRIDEGVEFKKIQEESDTLGKTLSFGRIGKACIGRKGLLAVNISVMITQLGFTVGYFIFFGNTLRDIVLDLTKHATDLPTAIPAINLTSQIASPLVATTMLPGHKASSRSLFSTYDLSHNTFRVFAVLSLMPVPFIIAMAFVRNIRKLGPVSMVANASLTSAYAATAMFMIVSFTGLHESVQYFNFATFPVFFGQITCAFEGIGTVIPIEGSMAENRKRYPCYLHITIALVAAMLSGFGIIGYLSYGHHVHQIITQDLKGPIAIALQIMLIIGVLFTYPLQLYPIVQITESMIRKLRRRNQSSTTVTEASALLLTAGKKQKARISTWEGNCIRVCLILFTAALALVFRDMFAYISALTGSIGSALLSYILPCIFHISLHKDTMSKWTFAKDVFLILFGIIGGTMGVVVTVMQMVEAFTVKNN